MQRILTAVLCIRSRPCSLRTNEDWPHLLTCRVRREQMSHEEVGLIKGRAKPEQGQPMAAAHCVFILCNARQSSACCSVTVTTENNISHVHGSHWEVSPYLSPCYSSTCPSTALWGIAPEDQFNTQQLCKPGATEPTGSCPKSMAWAFPHERHCNPYFMIWKWHSRAWKYGVLQSSRHGEKAYVLPGPLSFLSTLVILQSLANMNEALCSTQCTHVLSFDYYLNSKHVTSWRQRLMWVVQKLHLVSCHY